MARVFISHSSLDRDFVEREIISLLRAHGVDVWYSTDNIRTAAEWERQIHKGLTACDWFLIILSPRSVASDWVQREVHWAFMRRKGKIIPVMMEACDPDDLHIGLLPLQYIDFRDDIAKAQDRLLAVWGVDKSSRIKNQYLAAQEMIAKGDWATAAKYLEAVVRLDPMHLDAQRELNNVQQQQELATLYGAGCAHLNENRWREALEVFRQVQAIDKTYRDVAELVVEADAGLAEEEKQRQERERQEREAKEEAERQERERQEQQVQEQLYLEAQEASDRKDWPTAVEQLRAVLKLNPSHAEAQTALSQALRQKELAELYEIGVEHLQSERWSAALKNLRSVWIVDKRYRDITDLIAEAYAGLAEEEEQRRERERQEREAKEEADQQERERQALEQLYLEAQEALGREDWAVAREKLQAAQANELNKDEVTERLTEVDRLRQLATTYNRGLLLFESGQISQALAILRQVREVKGDYKDVAALIARAEVELNRAEQREQKKQEQLALEEADLKQQDKEEQRRSSTGASANSLAHKIHVAKVRGVETTSTLKALVVGISLAIGMLTLILSGLFYLGANAPASHYSKAETLFREGKYAAAEVAYRRAVELEPNNAQYHNGLGDALKSQKKYAEAEAGYRRAIELEPNSAAYHNNLGRVFREIADTLDEQKNYVEMEATYKKAEEAHRRAVEIEPNNAGYHNDLGIALNGVGVALSRQQKYEESKAEYKKAEEAHRRATEIAPAIAWHYYGLGFPLNNQNKHAEAEAAYRKAVEIEPKNAEYHSILGATLINQRAYVKAEAEFRKALELNPGEAKYHSNIGHVLVIQNKHAEAEAAYRKAVEIEPKNAKYHSSLGGALREQRKYVEAEAEYRKAIELEPDDPYHYQMLGYTLKLQQKIPESKAAYKKSEELRDKTQ